MTTKNKVIISVIVLITTFAVGRYSAPEKVRVEVKTVEVEKIVTKVVHVKTTTTEKPDGTKETTTVVDSRTDSSTNTKNTESKTEQTISKKMMNASVLSGLNLSSNNPGLVYGLSVSGNLLGPITVGSWGLTNSTFGVSLGLNF